MPLYDNRISSNIPMARVVDCMLLEEDKPEDICNVLKLYSSDDLKDISVDCDRWYRIFQYDFFCQLSDCNKDFVLKLLNYIPIKIAAYFAWQICSPYVTNIESKHKNFCRNFAKKVISNTFIPHPYKGRIYAQIYIEKKMFSNCNCLADNINEFAFSDFIKYTAISHSLFLYRMLQDDFFSSLSILNKWSFIHNIAPQWEAITPSALFKFCKQIVFSDCYDIDMQQAIIDILAFNLKSAPVFALEKYISKVDAFENDNEYMKMLLTAKSFSEISIKSAAHGRDLSLNEMIVFMLLEKQHILKDWFEIDQNAQKICPIFVKYN